MIDIRSKPQPLRNQRHTARQAAAIETPRSVA
jgi:hypothetical protein